MKLEGGERIVLKTLLDLQGDTGDYVDDARLAAATKMFVQDVRDWLETLEGKGLVEQSRGIDGFSAYVTAKGKQALRLTEPISIPKTARDGAPVPAATPGGTGAAPPQSAATQKTAPLFGIAPASNGSNASQGIDEIVSAIEEAENVEPMSDHPKTQLQGSSQKSNRVALRNVIEDPHSLIQHRLNSYAIRDFVGAGGSGLVYRAFHTGTGREVCIKLLYPVEDRNKAVLNIIARGVRALNSIADPYIINITDIDHARFADCSSVYLAMEYVAGVRLDEWSHGLQQSANPFAKRLRLAFTLAMSLSCTHSCRYLDEVGIEARGLLHGDLKPANVIVRPDDSPVIVDFLLIDIQRLLDPRVVPPHLLSSGFESDRLTLLYGTPGFMAPEQEREGVVTVKTDIYGLGMTLLHLFVPGGESRRWTAMYREMNDSNLDLILPLLRSMLAFDPNERPDDMKSIAR